MFAKFTALVGALALLASCGGPLENTWKTSCMSGGGAGASSIRTVKLDGDKFDYTVTNFVENTCETQTSSLTQSGTYALVDTEDKGRGGNIIVFKGADSIAVTSNELARIEDMNDALATRRQQQPRDIGNINSAVEIASIQRSNKILSEVKSVSNFQLGQAKTLNRFQAEGLNISPIFTFSTDVEQVYVQDGDKLILGETTFTKED